jgi:hypothetical protein
VTVGGYLHVCKCAYVLTMVSRGVPSSRGFSAPIVFITFRPLSVSTNQAHPEPKAVLPAASNSALKAAKDPKEAVIMSARGPVGSPPPPAFMQFQ